MKYFKLIVNLLLYHHTNYETKRSDYKIVNFRDQPNTLNSFISYSILSGNEDKKFSLEGSGKAVLVLRKKLDFEQGDTFFNLTVVAEVILLFIRHLETWNNV